MQQLIKPIQDLIVAHTSCKEKLKEIKMQMNINLRKSESQFENWTMTQLII